MSGKELKQSIVEGEDDGRNFLKKALIIFAIVEALVLIPFLVHMIFR
jgi:F0F1-type ATP synthase membrane subunit c/vacuolar-type H+-ATPase subunit K